MAQGSDHLQWNNDPVRLRRLEDPLEIVLYSNKLWKTNEKGKQQERILVITNARLYNIKPPTSESYIEVKRIISKERIVAFVMSYLGGRFVFQCTSEEKCDYLYVGHAQEVLGCLQQLIPHLTVTMTEENTLEQFRRKKRTGRNADFISLPALSIESLPTQDTDYTALLLYSTDRRITVSNLLQFSHKYHAQASTDTSIVQLQTNGKHYYLKTIEKGTKSMQSIMKEAMSNQVYGPVQHVLSLKSAVSLYFHYQQIEEFMRVCRRMRVTEKWEFIKKIAYTLCTDLFRFHAQGLVYGQVIPKNIEYRPSDSAVVRLRPDRVSVSALGPNITMECPHGHVAFAEYMAPEVLRSGLYRVEADWWSLGVVLRELIADAHPFLSAADLYEAIQSVEVRGEEIEDSDLRALILRLMHPDRERRLHDSDIRSDPLIVQLNQAYSSSRRAYDMVSIVSKLCSGEFVESRPIGHLMAFPRPTRRDIIYHSVNM